MRRTFLEYLERERPRPYSPFLHYNSWYDIGYTNRYSSDGARGRINFFGKELVEKRRVQLDSFSSMMAGITPAASGISIPDSRKDLHPRCRLRRNITRGSGFGFPHGVATRRRKSNVWPLGTRPDMRSKMTALLFRAPFTMLVSSRCAWNAPQVWSQPVQIRRDGQCKPGLSRQSIRQRLRCRNPFDRTASERSPWPFYQLDHRHLSFAVLALVRRFHLARRRRPQLFRPREFTPALDLLSECSTYKNIVLQGPLFPLNSLMLHGLIYAQHAEGLQSDPSRDFADEIHSYFGSGTQLQEMYITPSLLSTTRLEHSGRGSKLGSSKRSHFERCALGRRRPGTPRNLRLGRLEPREGHRNAPQSVG